MNFFGHAWVAGWFSQREPFILGSMLPDFANVLGVSPPASRHAELSAGIELHHATDRVFHDTEAFGALEHGAREALGNAGLRKGARRALAHIGVEFLIDAELGRRSPEWAGYARALDYGSSGACGSELSWRGSDTSASERLASLCSRLASVAREPADTRVLARRLVATLASRPRLALIPAEVPLVEAWLGECRPEVQARLPDLLAQLARELDAPVSRYG